MRIRDDVCKTASAWHTTGTQKEAVLFHYARFLLGSDRCSDAVCETIHKIKEKKSESSLQDVPTHSRWLCG